MTYSNYKKAFKQLKAKPLILEKYNKHNKPKERSCGRTKYRCTRCGRMRGIVRKYGLMLCRQCFREIATKIGFKKYS